MIRIADFSSSDDSASLLYQTEDGQTKAGRPASGGNRLAIADPNGRRWQNVSGGILQPGCNHLRWLSGQLQAWHPVPHLGLVGAQGISGQRLCPISASAGGAGCGRTARRARSLGRNPGSKPTRRCNRVGGGGVSAAICPELAVALVVRLPVDPLQYGNDSAQYSAECKGDTSAISSPQRGAWIETATATSASAPFFSFFICRYAG